MHALITQNWIQFKAIYAHHFGCQPTTYGILLQNAILNPNLSIYLSTFILASIDTKCVDAVITAIKTGIKKYNLLLLDHLTV